MACEGPGRSVGVCGVGVCGCVGVVGVEGECVRDLGVGGALNKE